MTLSISARQDPRLPLRKNVAQQVQQQTGVPLMHTEQQQPFFRQQANASQQACVISQQALSPLQQEIQHPSGVHSILQFPHTSLQSKRVMLFH